MFVPEKEKIPVQLQVDGKLVKRMGNFILNFSNTVSRSEDFLCQFENPKNLNISFIRILEINKLTVDGSPIVLFGVNELEDGSEEYIQNILNTGQQVAFRDGSEYL